jgi:hypothetical protein
VIAKLSAGVNARREELLSPVTAAQQNTLPVDIRFQPKLRQLAGITQTFGCSRNDLSPNTSHHGQSQNADRQSRTPERSILHGQFLMPQGNEQVETSTRGIERRQRSSTAFVR